ncbi:hypothetical protein BDD12DRAFT_875748 [Trichophaea hybrida]|nr:hypothetical protein BDD12DRAFT_875748 [Trichophaea hybrida]
MDVSLPEDVSDDEKIAVFFHGYEDYLGNKGAGPNTKSTLLHKMWRPSDYTDQPSENLQARVQLAKWLLNKHPKLLSMKDHHGNTPLIDAVKNDCKILVECYLASSEGAKAILVPGSDDDTCLTVAFKLKKLSRCIYPLLKMSDEKAIKQRDREGNTALHYAAIKPSCNKGLVEKLISLCPRALGIENSTGRSPYQARQHALGSLRKKFENQNREITPKQEVTMNGVTELIKYSCMKYSCTGYKILENVESILYGPGEELAISFDLDEYAKKYITRDDLSYLSKPLKFETILQWVCVPLLIVEPPAIGNKTAIQLNGRIQRPHSKHTPSVGKGRRDYETIFNWLGENGVSRILEVIVEDRGDVSHSDEAIENSLKKFQVEIWDWRRNDLCSETILRAAENARELFLYATGNNAVLRSWSSEDGLVRLKNLEKVHVSVLQGLERAERLAEYIEEFEKRMVERFKLCERSVEVNVTVETEGSSRDGQNSKIKMEQASNHWLDCMDTFASFVTNIQSQIPQEPALRPIRVAVIDDGINFRDNIRESITTGKSYSRWLNSPDRTRAYYVGHETHGTQMAALILRNGGIQFTTRSAAEAIRWVTTKGVDIISMSWSIERAGAAEEDIDNLRKAVREAHEKNILMFCATSDKGDITSEDLYPAACGSPMFRIGASKSTGAISPSVQSQRIDFVFPGEDVIVERQAISGDSKPRSGSSLGTAIAAGFAAMLLYCSELTNPTLRNALRKHERMEKVFKRLGGTNSTYPKVNSPFACDPRALGSWKKTIDHLVGKWVDCRLTFV